MPVLVAAVTLVLATVVVHVSGLYAATLHLVNIGDQDLSRRESRFFLRIVLVLTLYIVSLHMIEVSIWAAFYGSQPASTNGRRPFMFRWDAIRLSAPVTSVCRANGGCWRD